MTRYAITEGRPPERCLTIDEQQAIVNRLCSRAKPRYITCPVCRGWIVAGTLGPKGCPHCHGAKT